LLGVAAAQAVEQDLERLELVLSAGEQRRPRSGVGGV